MDISIIEAGLTVYGNDQRLAVEANLTLRQNAIDFIIYAEEYLQVNRMEADELADRLAELKRRLLAINAGLFERLQVQIRAGRYTPQSLRRELDLFTGYSPERQGETHVGPDGLDALLDGILELDKRFEGRTQADPDMVHYEPTPARAILDLIDHVELRAEDVFYDLGSGTGRAVILFGLATGLRSRGVEVDEELCEYARTLATRLQLANVEFIQADAREADYSEGTIFFMFTPFRGAILQTALDKLRREAERRAIQVWTYGSCTRWVAEKVGAWLRSEYLGTDGDFQLGIFQS